MVIDFFRVIFADVDPWLFMTIPLLNGYPKAALRFDRLQGNHISATHKLRRGEIVRFRRVDRATTARTLSSDLAEQVADLPARLAAGVARMCGRISTGKKRPDV
jgi:hypothetical protein